MLVRELIHDITFIFIRCCMRSLITFLSIFHLFIYLFIYLLIYFFFSQVGIIFPLWGLLLADYENLMFLVDGNRIRISSLLLFDRFLYLILGCVVAHMMQTFFINLACEKTAYGK